MQILSNTLQSMNYTPVGRWAWDNFLPLVMRLVRDGHFKSVLEIGGGRNPSFAKEDIESLGIRYTSNDISARELSLAPDWVGKAHFDIQTDVPAALAGHTGNYDFIFSRMVMEHVPNYHRAYRNISSLLKPGGMAISFHPTLFAFPFVVNKLIPESLSRHVLRFFFPIRSDEGIPKFPAYYSGCFNSKSVRSAIREEGFREVVQTPFYSHDYYRSIPIVRDLHGQAVKIAASLDLSPLTAYCFTTVQK